MAVPTVRAVGAVSSGVAAACTPGLPAGTVAGDLLLMFCESDNQAVTVSGWTEVPNSPQTSDGATATDTRLTIFYRIATSGSDATTTNAPADHVSGRIIGITAGTYDTSEPFNVTAGSTDATEDTSGSTPTITTNRNDCLIITALSHGHDAANSTANYASWTNASLTGLVEQIDNQRTAGNGGGFGVATWTLATAGATGVTTVTLAVNSLKGQWTGAINPARPIQSPTANAKGPQMMAICAM